MYYNLLQNCQKPFTVEMYRNFNFIDAPVATAYTGFARRPAPSARSLRIVSTQGTADVCETSHYRGEKDRDGEVMRHERLGHVGRDGSADPSAAVIAQSACTPTDSASDSSIPLTTGAQQE